MGKGWGSFFPYEYPFVPVPPTEKRLLLFQFCGNQLSVYMWVYFWALLALFYWSIYLSAFTDTHSLDFHSFITPWNHFVIFENYLSYSRSFEFPYIFENQLVQFLLQSLLWIWLGLCWICSSILRRIRHHNKIKAFSSLMWYISFLKLFFNFSQQYLVLFSV